MPTWRAWSGRAPIRSTACSACSTATPIFRSTRSAGSRCTIPPPWPASAPERRLTRHPDHRYPSPYAHSPERRRSDFNHEESPLTEGRRPGQNGSGPTSARRTVNAGAVTLHIDTGSVDEASARAAVETIAQTVGSLRRLLDPEPARATGAVEIRLVAGATEDTDGVITVTGGEAEIERQTVALLLRRWYGERAASV